VTGRFGSLSLEHVRRQFEVGQENLERISQESRRKNFARQTDPFAIKCKYRHCSLSIPVFEHFDAIFADTRKMGSLAAAQRRRPNSARSLIPETRSWLNCQRGSQPARLESKWKTFFVGSTENSEEPTEAALPDHPMVFGAFAGRVNHLSYILQLPCHFLARPVQAVL
jgi:hypothetical protein